MHHSVPYMLTNTGLAYLKSKVKDFEPTWAMFDRADLKGRMTMLNDMRETIGAALKFLGYSLNTTDDGELAQARDVVIRWKKNLAKFENEQYKTGLASGEFLLVHGYSGDILQVAGRERRHRLRRAPQEGTLDRLRRPGDPKDAEGVDLAHRSSTSCTTPRWPPRTPSSSATCARTRPPTRSCPRSSVNNPAVMLDPAVQAKMRSDPRPGRRQREVHEGLGPDQGSAMRRMTMETGRSNGMRGLAWLGIGCALLAFAAGAAWAAEEAAVESGGAVPAGLSYGVEVTASYHYVNHAYFGADWGITSEPDRTDYAWSEGFTRLRVNYGLPQGRGSAPAAWS